VFVEFCILGLVKEKKEDRGSGGVLGPRERERERERERGVELTDSSVGSRSFFVERGVYQRRGSACRKDVNGGAEIYLCVCACVCVCVFVAIVTREGDTCPKS
jgi:hypothetical protein